MTTYTITANAITSTYNAATEAAAIQAYVKDAGYQSVEAAADACNQTIDQFLADMTVTAATTYTVINENSGEAIATGLTAAEAAFEVLTDDSREFDIRAAEDGSGFDLWTRQQVANKGWTKTVVYSIEDDRDAAEAEIYAKVIAADWPRHPTVMTDTQYAEMQAELADD